MSNINKTEKLKIGRFAVEFNKDRLTLKTTENSEPIIIELKGEDDLDLIELLIKANEVILESN